MSNAIRPGQSNPDFTFGLDDLKVKGEDGEEKDAKKADKKSTPTAAEAEQANAASGANSTRQTSGTQGVEGAQDVFETSATKGPASGIDGPSSTLGQPPILDDSTATHNSVQDNANTTANVVNDIGQMFDNMERSIEVEFAKLKRDCRSNIDELNDKIKQMEEQIKKLHKLADKIEQIGFKMQTLLPEIMSAVGSDPGTRDTWFGGRQPDNEMSRMMGGGNYQNERGSAADQRLMELLKRELEPLGVKVNGDALMDIADAITKGGQGAMALATIICMEICKLSVEKAMTDDVKLGAKLSSGDQQQQGLDSQQQKQNEATAPTKKDKVGGTEEVIDAQATRDAAQTGQTPQADVVSQTQESKAAPADAAPTEAARLLSTEDAGSDKLNADKASPDEAAIHESNQSEWLGSAEEFAKKLEDLSKFAATYASSDPYMLEYARQDDGSYKMVGFKEAEAALCEGVFPGIAKSPSNVSVTTGEGKNKQEFSVEGFSISPKDFRSMMTMNVSQAADKIKSLIDGWVKTTVDGINKEIDRLGKEIHAAKDEIKNLEAQIDQLDKQKDQVLKQVRDMKEKVIKEALKVQQEQQKRELEAQDRVLSTLNDVLVAVFDTVRTTIEDDMKGLGFKPTDNAKSFEQPKLS